MKSYNEKIVTAFFKGFGIPKPEFEYVFHPHRKWRFDMAWPVNSKPTLESSLGSVALEVQGGIWSGGRHTRGAALLREWDKLNNAAALGWRILFCQPEDLLTTKLAKDIKAALEA